MRVTRYMSDFATLLDCAISDLQNTSDRLAEATSELAGMSFSGTSANHAVEATVDESGELTDVAISPGALKRSHPETLGDAALEALYVALQRHADTAKKN